jgi:hypothetical protein
MAIEEAPASAEQEEDEQSSHPVPTHLTLRLCADLR